MIKFEIRDEMVIVMGFKNQGWNGDNDDFENQRQMVMGFDDGRQRWMLIVVCQKWKVEGYLMNKYFLFYKRKLGKFEMTQISLI